MSEDSNIHCYINGPLAFCVLNRPKQLNALTETMNASMKHALLKWRENPSIKAIIISSSSPKAFCAGGDIKLAYTLGQHDPKAALSFFKIEYEMNLLIATYPKPIISFCQGITMGGGCGIGFHASHAIAGDHIQLAMPETKIGLFPDIGASYLLPRLAHHVGFYLGLTGHSIHQADVIYAQLMRYGMNNAEFQNFSDSLMQMTWSNDAFGDIEKALHPYLKQPDPSCALAGLEPSIDQLFQASSLKKILEKADEAHSNNQSDWEKNICAELKKRSPQSLAMTWESFKRGKTMSLAAVLKQDLKLASVCLKSQDFYRGVKACLIDRCEPVWTRESIHAYSEHEISQWFL
jgi:enoyl-CoA hydratase